MPNKPMESYTLTSHGITMSLRDLHSTLVHLILSKIQLANWGQVYTHTLKNFCLGMPNLCSTYYIERCYLEVFFLLYEGKIPEVNHHKIFSSSSLIVF